MEHKGYIYIFTNPSFPEYVKIGYATNVQQRLNELNRSTAVPFAFRVYATYEVDSNLSDKKLHSILDKLNPDLRSMEQINGKKRIREFYAMPPEDAYAILDAIAEINGYSDRLKKWAASEEEKRTPRLRRASAKHIGSVWRRSLSPCAGYPSELSLCFGQPQMEPRISSAPLPGTKRSSIRISCGH